MQLVTGLLVLFVLPFALGAALAYGVHRRAISREWPKLVRVLSVSVVFAATATPFVTGAGHGLAPMPVLLVIITAKPSKALLPAVFLGLVWMVSALAYWSWTALRRRHKA